MIHTGRHFLQIPGPTNVPDRVLRAIDQPVIDHRGPGIRRLGTEVLEGMRGIFKNSGPRDHFSGVRHGSLRSGDREHACRRATAC